MHRSLRALTVPALALSQALTLSGCGGDGPPPTPAADTVPEAAAAADEPPRLYERRIAFLASRSDTAPAVVWLVDAASRERGVERTAWALLVRGGEWDRFLDEVWSTPPTRAPWRILPRGPMRLVVSEDEALERVVYSAPPRELAVRLGDALVDWTGRRGEALRLLAGGLGLGGAEVPGYVLDLARTADPGRSAGGDWAFLVSGDSLQMVLHASDPTPETDGNLFQAWARLDFRELAQPGLQLVWDDTRSFEPARRSVPVAWSFTDPDGVMAGRLEVVSSWLEAGQGPGPQLPVDAVFQVAGTVTLDGVEYPVRGLFRHTQN